MVRPKTWRAFKLLEQRRQSQGLLSYHRFQYFMSIFVEAKSTGSVVCHFGFECLPVCVTNHCKIIERCILYSFFSLVAYIYFIGEFTANMLQLLLLSGSSQAPGLVLPLLSSAPSSCGRWWRRELEGRASGVVAVGTSPGTLGPLSPLVW